MPQPVSANPDDCRKRAEECVQLAQTAPASQRATLLEIAQVWLRLADQSATENALMNGGGKKRDGGPST